MYFAAYDLIDRHHNYSEKVDCDKKESNTIISSKEAYYKKGSKAENFSEESFYPKVSNIIIPFKEEYYPKESDTRNHSKGSHYQKDDIDHKNIQDTVQRLQGAYLTIELSLIFPIILLVIVLVVHWSFMMYDRVIMSQDAYLLALRGAVISDDEPEQYALDNSDWQFGAWYFGSGKPSVQTSSDWLFNNVEVTLSMETYHGGTSYYGINPQGKWASSISWKASYTRPAKRVRLFTRAYDLYKVFTEALTSD